MVDLALLGFTLSIYFYITQDFGSEEETFRFKLLVGTLAVYLFSDFILGLVYGDIVQIGFYPNMLVVYTNLVTMSLISFLWYRYALLRISPELDENKWQTVISSIPIIYIIILFSGSVFNGWAFTLHEGGGFEQADWFVPAFAAGLFYLFVIAVMAAARYARAKGGEERSRYRGFMLFLLPPILAVVVELLVPKTPVMGIGVYAAVHLVFFSYQSRRIHNDALTGLNNRRRIDSYLEAHIGNTEMGLYLFDINRFKEVNDRFGHTEGDRALCDVAEAIRAACANRQAIAARYGGDEFAVVSLIESGEVSENPEEFIGEVRKHLAKRVEERKLNYSLTVSAGYARASADAENTKPLFEAADRALYIDKAHWHERIKSVLDLDQVSENADAVG